MVDLPEDLLKPLTLADSGNARVTTGSSNSRSDLLQLRNSEPCSVEMWLSHTFTLFVRDAAEWRRKRPHEDNVGEPE